MARPDCRKCAGVVTEAGLKAAALVACSTDVKRKEITADNLQGHHC